MQETRNNCFCSKIYSMTLHQAYVCQASSVHCCFISALVLTCFYAWQRVMLHIFDSNNCWEPLAPCGVIIQSVIQSYLKTPVWGASLSYHDYHVASRRHTPIPYNGKHEATKKWWQFIIHSNLFNNFITDQLNRAPQI